MKSVVLAFVLVLASVVIVNDMISMYWLKLEDVKKEISDCTTYFNRNKCEKPVPLTEVECAQWKLCKDRDAEKVAYEQLMCLECVIHMVGRIVDSLSIKTIVFGLVLIGLALGRG